MGIFITFEGGEGSGKSVQAKLLCDFMKSQGYAVILSREPGGTDLSEEIRKMLLIGDPQKIDPLTESLLYLAARSNHWSQKIKPALDAGKAVICDRFQDSSLVYQGFCKHVNIDMINLVFEEITKSRFPNRTYLLDIDPKIGLARSLSRQSNNETRFEKMDLSFHEDVRKAFLELANRHPKRFLVIDATLPIDEIYSIIKRDIQQIAA